MNNIKKAILELRKEIRTLENDVINTTNTLFRSFEEKTGVKIKKVIVEAQPKGVQVDEVCIDTCLVEVDFYDTDD